jgi:hypothetical protein
MKLLLLLVMCSVSACTTVNINKKECKEGDDPSTCDMPARILPYKDKP